MTADSRVTEVQIYRNSMSVVREGTVHLPEGRSTVFIKGMSKSSEDDSFTVKFPSGVRALNIQVVDAEETGEKVLESEKIAKELAEVNHRAETYSMMIELLKKNGDFSDRKGISAEDQAKYLELLPDKIFDFYRRVSEENERKSELSKKLSEAESEEEKPLIMAELDCTSEGDYPFTLRYRENAGGWEPKYEVRFTGEKNPLEVYMKARITQESKEDWKQVKVTLYTGNPSASQSIPVLPRITLSIAEPAPPAERMRFAGVSKAMMASRDTMPLEEAAMAMPMPMYSMRTPEAAVSEEETMTAFELPGLRDILSDTGGNIADLQSFKVNAKINVLCVPSVKDTCFLSAAVKPSDWPLPPANAAIYLKDLYAGEVYVNPDTAEDDFVLSLGQDERLSVSRRELPVKSESVFLKNQRKKSHEYEIKLTNKSSEPIKVLVKESVPVSADKVITVDISELSGGELDEETGEIRWETEIEGRGTKKLKIAYSVAWPKNKSLNTRRDRL